GTDGYRFDSCRAYCKPAPDVRGWLRFPDASLLLGLEHLDLFDPRPLVERPLEPHPRLDRRLLDGGNDVLVRSAAVLRQPALPVRHVAPGLLLAVGLHLDPIFPLGRDDPGHGPLL